MFKKGSIYKKLTFSYICMMLLVLLLVTAYSTRVQMRQVREAVDHEILNLSLSLSLDPSVRDSFAAGSISPAVKAYLHQLSAEMEHIDYIVLVGSDDIRLYHPDEKKIGKPFQGGDEIAALEGSAPYITDGFGSLESQRRAFTTVYDAEHNPLGFIMVSAATESILLLLQEEIMRYLTIFGIALVIGIVFITVFSENLYDTLLGLEPKQLSKMFLQREDVLETLSEGLLLVNERGSCEYFNASAARLLAENDPAEIEKRIPQFILSHIPEKQTAPLLHQSLKIGEQHLLIDLIPVSEESRKTLVILNDRTETMRLGEELTGVKHILEALRTTTHENRNKLHVIYGLLQTGATEDAISFISDSVSEDEDNQSITEVIRDKTVAALIIGKKRRAKELRIDFRLLKGSCLEENNPFLPSLALVTIIGNLLENAYEAIREDSAREVSLYLNSSKEGLFIIVDDTGIGMDSETAERIQQESYTTKGEGHGTGFTLIRNLTREYGGVLSIESEPEEGSSISITFRKRSEGE